MLINTSTDWNESESFDALTDFNQSESFYSLTYCEWKWIKSIFFFWDESEWWRYKDRWIEIYFSKQIKVYFAKQIKKYTLETK